jgi:hypothetical protein
VLEQLSHLLFHLHPSKYDAAMLHAAVQELFGFDSL